MQALRFGAFTPAQQAVLDQLTGGRSFRDAVLNTFDPLTQEEMDGFTEMAAESCDYLRQELDQFTPEQLEKEIEEDLDFVINGEAEKELAQELARVTDPAERRELLLGLLGAPATGFLKALRQWKDVPTDKTFEAVVKLAELVKDTLKF